MTDTHAITEADSMLDSTSPGTNYGSQTTVIVGYSGPSIFRAVMRFDISAVPAVERMHGAALFLRQSAYTGSGSHSIWVCRCTEAWIEAQVTWNARVTGIAWADPGGTYTETDKVVVDMETKAGIRVIPGLGPIADYAVKNESGLLNLLLRRENESSGNAYATFNTKEFAPQDNQPQVVVVTDAGLFVVPSLKGGML